MGNDIKDVSYKNFKRWVPLGDKIAYLGLPVLFTLGAIGAALTPQDWSLAAMLITSGVVLGSWGFGIGIILKRIFAKPEIEIKNGPQVWTNDLPVTKDLIKRSIHHFKIEADKRGFASMEQLDKMFDRLNVEYVKKPIRFTNKIKTGFAWGTQSTGTYFIRVMWRGGSQNDSFFHECAHVLRNVTLGLDPDYRHRDKRIWDFVAYLKNTYEA